MHKRIIAFIYLFIILISFTACFDAKEIGEYAYASVLGIDLGLDNKFRVTFQIPNVGESGGKSGEGRGGGGGEKKEEKNTITIEAPSFFSAVAIANTNLSKILNFMHLEAIVVSEDMAKSGMMGELVIPYVRYREIRRISNLIVCKGKAEDFVKAIKPYMGELVNQTLEELFKTSSDTGLYPTADLSGAYNGMKSSYHSYLCIYGAVNKGENMPKESTGYQGEYKIPADYYAGDEPRTEGQEIELLGSAIFDGDKMTGKLTGFETQMLLLIRGELTRAPFTIPDLKDPKLVIPIDVKEFETPKVKIDVKGDKPRIKAQINLEGDITIIQSRAYYESTELIKKVERAFEKYVEEGIKRTFEKCRQYKSDVFLFGTYAVQNFLTIPEWEEYNWLSKFPNSELDIKVHFTARRTGKMVKSMPVISSEGKE